MRYAYYSAVLYVCVNKYMSAHILVRVCVEFFLSVVVVAFIGRMKCIEWKCDLVSVLIACCCCCCYEHIWFRAQRNYYSVYRNCAMPFSPLALSEMVMGIFIEFLFE